MNSDKLVAACTHPKEHSALDALQAWFVAEDAILTHHETVEEEGRYPDLLGKSVLVGGGQFPQVASILQRLAGILEIPAPPCFVYESYAQVCDSEGCQRARLEISARAIRDLSEAELTHLVAKEMFHVRAGHLRTEVLAEKMLSLIGVIPQLPGINLLKQFGSGMAFDAIGFNLRSAAFRWFRYACFSAERFALAVTGSFKASIDAVLMSVLNERSLVNELRLPAFLQQAGEIEACLGPVATLEKLNEVIPYAPVRVREMLTFAASPQGRQLISTVRKERGISTWDSSTI